MNVTAASHCAWTAVSDSGWMSIVGGSNGAGNGAITVSVTGNPSEAPRTATLTVASQSVPVQQAALACTLEISPGSASYGKDAATGSFSVTAPAECAWTATSSAPWMVIVSGSGAGNGTVSYAIERNNDVPPRSAAIAIGGRRFELTQAGDTPAPVCEYSVGPVELRPCMSVPFSLTATLTTQPGCSWTANPDSSWITMTSDRSGSGPSVISFTVSDNWDAPRHGIVMVRWPTPTAGQNLHIRQAGCRYAVSATTIGMDAAAGTGRFDVLQQSDPTECGGALQNACRWTAESDVPWITITTSMPQAGDNRVSFTVSANGSTTARIGRIRVRDQVVQITQSGM